MSRALILGLTLVHRDFVVNAGEGEALEETGRVFLVATEAVQRLGEHDIEPTVQRVRISA